MSAVLDAARPGWTAREPDYVMDYDQLAASGAPPLPAIIGTLGMLGPEEILLMRVGFDPALLLRALVNRGFESWTVNAPGKGVEVFFTRRAGARGAWSPGRPPAGS